MSQKYDRSLETLKNASTRQRWELFHRAIASAKQSNTEAMQQAEGKERTGADADAGTETGTEQRTELSIAR